MALRKIISGGQSGADIAALRVARALGYETGGWMPKGFHTLGGDRPEYEREYGMLENDSTSYRERTYLNVHGSDGTLRLAHDFSSPGERCTLRAICYYERPSFDVPFEMHPGIPSQIVTRERSADVREWIAENNIEVLNVAGNAGVWFEPFVEDFLTRVFSIRVPSSAA